MSTEERSTSDRSSNPVPEVRWEAADDRRRYEALLRRLFRGAGPEMNEPGEGKSPGSASDDLPGASRPIGRSAPTIP